jgi:hypothetical protein
LLLSDDVNVTEELSDIHMQAVSRLERGIGGEKFLPSSAFVQGEALVEGKAAWLKQVVSGESSKAMLLVSSKLSKSSLG